MYLVPLSCRTRLVIDAPLAQTAPRGAATKRKADTSSVMPFNLTLGGGRQQVLDRSYRRRCIWHENRDKRHVISGADQVKGKYHTFLLAGICQVFCWHFALFNFGML